MTAGTIVDYEHLSPERAVVVLLIAGPSKPARVDTLFGFE